jgi:hypothetical protein
MEINVLLIDDNAVTLRHLFQHLAPLTKVNVDEEVITCTFRQLQPLRSRDDPTKIDLAATLKEAVRLKPGVAVIDLRLEGDVKDDYSGADLSLRIKAVCGDCCIILVSHYFDEAPRLLDNLEVFRYRVDRNQAGYGDELRTRFTEAIRGYISAMAFRGLLGTPVAQLTSRAVYLSYARDAHGDSSAGREEIVNRIEKSLRTNGYDVKRDSTNLGFANLVSAFMDEIGRGGCVVAVVSDKYILSRFCMDELLKVYRNHDFHERICPIVLPDANITNLKGRLSYVNYWTRQLQDLRNLFRKIRPDNVSLEELSELHVYRDITQEAGRLISFIADMNQLTPEALEKDDFAILRNRIDQCLSQQSGRGPAH